MLSSLRSESTRLTRLTRLTSHFLAAVVPVIEVAVAVIVAAACCGHFNIAAVPDVVSRNTLFVLISCTSNSR